MSLEILGHRLVMFSHGYDGRGLPSQLTAVRLAGVEAYVREARRTRSIDHFVMSSGARLGHKADGDRIPGVEILELAAPPKHWKAIAAAVAELDALEREVRRSSRWSLEDARALYLSGRRSAIW